MSAFSAQVQVPLLIILAGMASCLVFEVAGVPEGLRRYGSKSYILLIAAVVVSSVFTLVFRTSLTSEFSLDRSSILALSVLTLGTLAIAAQRLKNDNGDHGELYAFILLAYFSNIIMCDSSSAAVVLGGLVASVVAQVGILSMRKKRRTSAEVALKLSLLCAFLIVVLALLFILEASGSFAAHGILLAFIALFMIGAVPLQNSYVDVLDGAPSYGAAFHAAATLISATNIILRFVKPSSFTPDGLERLQFALILFALLSVVLVPFMALDQRRVSRLVAYLFNSQVSLVLMVAIIHVSGSKIPAYFNGFMFTHFALCSLGAFAGLNYWKTSRHAFRTWEDFAGAGREHPIACGALFFVLACLCGLPFTSGFLLRTQLLEMAPQALRFAFMILVAASVILPAIPLYRLFAFFFGKTTRHELRKHAGHGQVFLAVLCAGLLFLAGLAPLFVLQAIFGS